MSLNPQEGCPKRALWLPGDSTGAPDANAKAAERLCPAASSPLFAAPIKVSTCWLVVFASAVFASAMRCRGMRGGVGCTMRSATMRCCGMAACSDCRAMPTVGCIGAAVSTAGNVPASSSAIEAMFTPAVAVAPVRPGAHAQEDAVIEIARPIEAARRAAVRCIVVIAIGTDRLNAYADRNLCAGGWRQDQGDEQSCRTGQKQTSHGELMSPARYAFDLPHGVFLPNICSRYPSFQSKTRWFKYRLRAGG
jgi:hypothetical protein